MNFSTVDPTDPDNANPNSWYDKTPVFHGDSNWFRRFPKINDHYRLSFANGKTAVFVVASQQKLFLDIVNKYRCHGCQRTRVAVTLQIPSVTGNFLTKILCCSLSPTLKSVLLTKIGIEVNCPRGVSWWKPAPVDDVQLQVQKFRPAKVILTDTDRKKVVRYLLKGNGTSTTVLNKFYLDHSLSWTILMHSGFHLSHISCLLVTFYLSSRPNPYLFLVFLTMCMFVSNYTSFVSYDNFLHGLFEMEEQKDVYRWNFIR